MKVAVVIPIHYCEFHMEAIQSVLGQKRQPDYTVCVFNGIEDEEYELGQYQASMMALAAEVSWPIYCPRWEEGSVSAARNIGFEEAERLRCDFVLPLDEDDILHPNYLMYMERAAEAMPNYDVFYPDWAKFGGWSGYTSTPDYSFEELKEHPFIISTAMISVRAWQRVREFNGTGYDEELVHQGLRWEDYLFYLTVGAMGMKMARVAPGALVRVRGSGEGSQIANKTRDQWYDYANKALGPLGVQLAQQTG